MLELAKEAETDDVQENEAIHHGVIHPTNTLPHPTSIIFYFGLGVQLGPEREAMSVVLLPGRFISHVAHS